MLLVCFLAVVFGGLFVSLYAADAWAKLQLRRAWDAETARGLADDGHDR